MSQFYGSNLTQLNDEYTGDPRYGRQITRRIRGTPTQILAQADAAAANGLRYTVRELSQGGHQELTVAIGASEVVDKNAPLSVIWTHRANEIEKNIWDTQKVFDALSVLSAGDVAKFRWGVEAVISGQIDDISHFVIPPGIDSAFVFGLVSALAMGVESKPISLSVVTRKAVVPPDTNLRPNFVGVDMVIEGANLVAGNDPATGGPIPSNILWLMRDGWYQKKLATVEQTSATTWEITQEWWGIGEYYHTFVFDEYGATPIAP